VGARIDATKALKQRWKEGEGVPVKDRSHFLQPDIIYHQDEAMANLRLCLNVRTNQFFIFIFIIIL
jgi:hypothetical protein